MNKIFVVGAGTMGLDIAQVFAGSGIAVIVRDIAEDIISKAAARLEASLGKLVAKGKMEETQKSAILEKITFTTELKRAEGCDVVLEAIVENMDIKKSLFKELDGICKPSCIFATNTSAISITEIASVTSRADRFVGMHFFNPATMMKLIEVIRGAKTSDETFRAVFDLSVSIGKDPVEVSESAGFVVNRLLVPMINDAVSVYAEGVASVEDIDKAMRLGANHPMGPLTLADFVGLDVCLAIMETLYAETGDPKYRPAPLLRKMVRGGLLGKKSGEGFYKYN